MALAALYRFIDWLIDWFLDIDRLIVLSAYLFIDRLIDWQVQNPDKSAQVGKISKQWTGLLQEMYTSATNFGISCESL